MAQFILRVDDCGWTPDKADDRGLEYFRRWRDAFGIAGLPVYYGFIPATLGLRELDWLRDNLSGGERLSVHGYDHARGPVSPGSIDRGLRFLWLAGLNDRPSYIAPFNSYDQSTLDAWDLAAWWIHGGEQVPYFFGGFPDDEQSLNFSELPHVTRWPQDGRRAQLIHLPAYKPLYDRARVVAERLDEHLHFEHPVVVTLHATWDANTLGDLPLLLEKLKPHLVGVEAAEQWLRSKGVAL